MRTSSARGAILIEAAIVMVVAVMLLAGYAKIFGAFDHHQRLAEAVELAARAGARDRTWPVDTARQAFSAAAEALNLDIARLRCNVRVHEVQLSSDTTLTILEVAASRTGSRACARSHFAIESGVVDDPHIEEDAVCFPGEDDA